MRFDRFEEGQLSGPYGPKFVGYAEQRQSLADHLKAALAGGAGIAAVAFGLMLLAGRW